MTDHPAVTDEAIRSMLDERARRARPPSFVIDAIVAAAGPRAAHQEMPGSSRAPRLALLGGAVAAVLVVALAVVGPLASRPAGRATPGPGASSVTPGPPSTPLRSTRAAVEPIRLLSPAEAGALIRTRSAALAGTLIVVDGRLDTDVTPTCPLSMRCSTTILADAGSGIGIRPVGDIGPGPWDGSGPVRGALILRLSTATENQRRIAEFVGRLTTPPTGGPAWFVQDLLEGAAHVDGSYAAVEGWLVRDPLHPCASDPHPPVVAYGCPTDDWLSEDAFQPLQPDGSSIGPPAALSLSSGSYDRWAPDPARAGPDGVGVEPREATYLLRLVSDGCGASADCAPPAPRWNIVGRLDPIAGLVAAPTSSPSPSPQIAPPPSGSAWTVADLQAARWPGMSPREFVVRAWLVATPPLRCVARPVPSGLPDFGCDEVDWLTDEPFQPWVADGSTGATRNPPVGIRVQNGAYAAFAPGPASGPFGARTPRQATFLVRFAVHSTCEYGALGAACLGGPMFTWEILAQVAP